MSKRKKNIEEFFSGYESHFNNSLSGRNVDETEKAIVGSFADCFIESSPLGVNCSRNGKEFLTKIQQGFDFYKGIGSNGMSIVSKDITLLDDFHAMVKVYWNYAYVKDNIPGSVDFHVFYMLTTINEEIKIFAYIAGDEQKALREKGLVANEQEVMVNEER